MEAPLESIRLTASGTKTEETIGERVLQPRLVEAEPISNEPAISSTTGSSTVEKSTEEAPPGPEGIHYRIEYRNVSTNKLVHAFQYNKREFDITNQSRPNIFEIVTAYRTVDHEFKSESNPEVTTPLVADTRKKVTMVIHSVAIINALRSVVEYYPDQDLLRNSVSIPEPYPILVHHEKELAEFRERCNPANVTESLCIREEDAYQHLTVLNDFLEETIMPAVRAEQERNKKGIGLGEMVWFTLRPGTTRSMTFFEQKTERDCVIESVKGGVLGFGEHPWEVTYWVLDYDGQSIGRSYGNYISQTDAGQVNLLQDLTFGDPPNQKELPTEHARQGEIDKKVSLGKKFFELLAGKCQYHTGKSATFPFRKIEGLVQADLKTFYHNSEYSAPTVTFDSKETSWVSDCSCPICKEREKEKKAALFGYYDGLGPDNTLTAHQFFLLPKTVWVFVFKTRVWEEVLIDNLSEPVFKDSMIDTLVMDPARLQTIKALAGSYIRENKDGEKSDLEPWSADFIQGKRQKGKLISPLHRRGQGQIFLLHGKPGVGKTYTAECIAQYTKRPLLVLTSSDVGTRPEAIEKILLEQFKKASTWGAILLIDEADVFMEQRSTNDLNRNSLVAGFLRALEFYEGILFLTTNRVGTFDDAFISRIHVQLYYPDFTDEERQRVWKTFMDKLSSERGKSIRVAGDAREYIRGREIKAVKWNGREIRNAFQTAVALAEYEVIKDEEGIVLLKESHLSAVVKMSADFKDYLEKLHLADENKRAQRQGLRYDEER